MTLYTVTLQYDVPRFATFTVSAADEGEAQEKALALGETADADKWEESYDAGGTYVTACQPYEESDHVPLQ